MQKKKRNGAYPRTNRQGKKVCVWHGSPARISRQVLISLDVFGCGVGCGIASLADV